MLEFSEPIRQNEDVWGWVEPDLYRSIYGYQWFPPLVGPGVARARFDIVDETIPSITSVKDVLISTRTTGGKTGGWNEDKSKFAVIRTQGSSPGPGITDFLTYVDTSSEDPTMWALAADILEVTAYGSDLAQQLKFVPTTGQLIARIYNRAGGAPTGRVSETVDINTAVRTVLGYESFFPGFTGHVYRHAWSPEGQWVAYTLDGNATGAGGTFQGTGFTASAGDGVFVFRRSDGALVYHDAVAVNDDTSYRLFHFPEDSATFVYMSGTTVKVVSTASWTVVQSQAFASEPRPAWVSPGKLFYTGYDSTTGLNGRIWDANFNVVYSAVGDGVTFDWNQEGTRVWGAIDSRKDTVTTPGYVVTDVGLLTNEGGYRMRPWL